MVKKSIVIEDVFEKVFSYLPEMSFDENQDKYPVVFGYGDEIELNSFLAKREVSSTYPLIWMLYPINEEHNKNRVKCEGLSFIWDAIKLTIDLELISGCIKPIKFFS